MELDSSAMESFDQALALHQQGKIREAVALYRQALDANPKDHRAMHWMGVAAYQLRDVPNAQGWFQQALAEAPDNPDYHLSFGRLLQETGRPLQAVDAFREVLKRAPNHQQARYRLALVLHRIGDHDEALELYQALLAEHPDDPALLVNMGALLNLVGRSVDAVPLYERAIALQPDMAAAHGNLGNALAELRRYDEAIPAFARSLELQPGQPKIHANLGSCELVRGNLDAAVAGFETCLQGASGDITALAMLAAVHNEQGRRDSAAALLDYENLLWSVDVPNADALLPQLREHVLSHPSLQSDPNSHTTKLGQQTGSLWPSDDADVQAFVKFVEGQVTRYAESRPAAWKPIDHLPSLWPAPDEWRIDMWATVLTEGGHQTPHIHPSGWLSGVFYV
ncbi:MAG: tetratricopeptide repeat protein, partial [Gammaproteobacteria bacterium]|nr:tetratricopeptide repeat protein [Gammaproteobacteria bacterium]